MFHKKVLRNFWSTLGDKKFVEYHWTPTTLSTKSRPSLQHKTPLAWTSIIANNSSIGQTSAKIASQGSLCMALIVKISYHQVLFLNDYQFYWVISFWIGDHIDFVAVCHLPQCVVILLSYDPNYVICCILSPLRIRAFVEEFEFRNFAKPISFQPMNNFRFASTGRYCGWLDSRQFILDGRWPWSDRGLQVRWSIPESYHFNWNETTSWHRTCSSKRVCQ